MADHLPPSDQFARYLLSPIHARRMEAGKARMLQRMNNFHAGEVYPAISEALGSIAALSEFYSAAQVAARGLEMGQRSIVSHVAGDPLPNRPSFDELEASAPDRRPKRRAPLTPKLNRADRKLLGILSDGAPRTREQILEETGSRAQTLTAVNAKISELRRKLEGTGIVIETGPGPTYTILGPSCGMAKAMAEEGSA